MLRQLSVLEDNERVFRRNPTYRQVFAGDTGYIEAARITYGTGVIDFPHRVKIVFFLREVCPAAIPFRLCVYDLFR